jgi:uncharacterized SAM-binding protein YcdF (DUF218 family)
MADPVGPNKAGRADLPMSEHLRRPTDPLLRRDLRHSLGVAALAVLLTGGLLYAVYVLRVYRVARHSRQHADDGDCVLVFGKALRDGQPDADYRKRLAHALALAQHQPRRPLILLGGGAPGASEAEVGLRELQALGLPEAVPVRLEDQSLDTLQNLRNARQILAAEGPARVLLLSNRYHLARCSSLARALGLDARPCAAEPRFRLREQGLARLLQEGAFLCWLEVGTAWARLIGHRRMLERVS